MKGAARAGLRAGLVARTLAMAFLITGAVPALAVSASERAPVLAAGAEPPPGMICTVPQCPEVNPGACSCTEAEIAMARILCGACTHGTGRAVRAYVDALKLPEATEIEILEKINALLRAGIKLLRAVLVCEACADDECASAEDGSWAEDAIGGLHVLARRAQAEVARLERKLAGLGGEGP